MNLSGIINSLGTLSILNFARKHFEKLQKADSEDVRALATRIQGPLDELELAYTARRPLASLVSSAVAAKDAADDDLDTLISSLSYELLGPKMLNGERAHPFYRGLFPEGNIGFINGPERVQIIQVKAMVAYLNATSDHPLTERASELEAKVMTLEALIEPVRTAESALKAAREVERLRRADLDRALRKTLALLRAELMDEDKVNRFYPPQSALKDEDE